MKQTREVAVRSQSGFALVNILLALIVLSVVVIGLASANMLATKNLLVGREYGTVTMVAQTKLDSLMALGWDSLAGVSGSDTVWGHAVQWTVQGTNPREVTMVVERRGDGSMRAEDGSMRADSFMTMVAKR